MKKITFNKLILVSLCITYFLTFIFMFLAFPIYGCNNTNEYLPYAMLCGMVIPIVLSVIWLMHEIRNGKFDKLDK